MKKFFLLAAATLIASAGLAQNSRNLTSAEYRDICLDRAEKCIPLLEQLHKDLAYYEQLCERSQNEYMECSFWLNRGCPSPYVYACCERARRCNIEYCEIADGIRTRLTKVQTFFDYCISESERMLNYGADEPASYPSKRVLQAKEIS